MRASKSKVFNGYVAAEPLLFVYTQGWLLMDTPRPFNEVFPRRGQGFGKHRVRSNKLVMCFPLHARVPQHSLRLLFLSSKCRIYTFSFEVTYFSVEIAVMLILLANIFPFPNAIRVKKIQRSKEEMEKQCYKVTQQKKKK